MHILGVTAFYHDSAASLIKDGKIISALEEERFTRVKHDNSFPYKAINFCLKANNLSMSDIDYIAYYEKPLLKFERILQTFVETWPFSLHPFRKSIPEWLGERIKVGYILRKKLGFRGKTFFIPHHLSHAASVFLTSPFKNAAILTIDGVGDLSTTGMWIGNKNNIENIGEIHFPHSLGLFYSTFTSFLGFRVNNDEYKVMGLAAYGKPLYANNLRNLIRMNKDGSFELDLSYFSFRESFRMWSNKFEALFGNPRKPGSKIEKRHRDIAASLQSVTEEVYFRILQKLFQETKLKNLCISGGVALNSLANGKIFDQTLFEKIYNFGPAGDSGTSVGAALYVYNSLLKRPRKKCVKTLYFGSKYPKSYIEKLLKYNGLKYQKTANREVLVDNVANMLYMNKIVGWFQGRMEFGPRALGARSILANPTLKEMKGRVNKIKRREGFRPFAGSVLQKKVDMYFNVPKKNYHSPFMNFCFKVKEEAKTKIPAIVHADGTCRIQTVSKDNGLYYKLIKKFYDLTGLACILNTSFNLSFEPIVETPQQAIDDFKNSPMDILVLEDFLIYK